MRSRTFTRLSLLVIPLMVACQPNDDSGYRGYLYYAQDSYLMQFSLRDGSRTVVTAVGDRKIREISQLGEGRLLIAELATLSWQTVARISWMDLKTNRSEPLYSGVRARFVADAGVIVYDDGSKLYAVPLAGESELDSVILAHRRHQLTAMVGISGTRLLFEVQEQGRPVIHAYDAANGTLQTLEGLGDACELDGSVWIDELELLACRDRDGEGDRSAHAYVLADLEGNVSRRLQLPEGGSYLALAYIPGQDALIFRETWRSDFADQPRAAIWAHDIHSGSNQQLSDSVDPGTSVVYTDL